jgi:3-hydroxyisobutyrate dehydrogenase-like beta-hydroxyacid dehydrogenase
VERGLVTSIALIGFGEVGVTLADDLVQRGARLSAWDIKFDARDSKPSIAARERSLRIGSSAVDAAKGADLVVCAVTAAQTLAAAIDTAPGLSRNALYLDLNSASAAAKIEASHIVNVQGGRYLEAAVMSPIGPKRIASPILLGGRYADEALKDLHQLGFVGASAYSNRYGRASAAKLCRSVVVKGIEALLLESLSAAEHYGVEDTVLSSLSDLFPNQDWQALSFYMMSRAVEHGARRAEEMREAAKTVAAAGFEPFMSAATAQRQDWAAQFSGALPARELSDLLQTIQRSPAGTET